MDTKPRYYNDLIDLINEYTPFDCLFIVNTQEYKDLKDYFKSFFGEEFSYKKVVKLSHNCFVYKSYIIKFNCKKTPKDILKIPEVVNTYYRNNFKFNYDNRILYLGVEIQDYIQKYDHCSKEEIYQIYKSLRTRGLEWIDANYGNIIKKDGKILIIDSDYIYGENEANYINQSKLSKEFKERFEKENKNNV